MRTLALAAALALAGCGDPSTEELGPTDGPAGPDLADGKTDTSVDAIFLDFEFDGELLAKTDNDLEARIESQLLFTIGLLNGERSVGRIDRVELSEIESTDTEEGTLVSYHARMPVAWGQREKVPETFELRLPFDVSWNGQKRFTEKYGHDCVHSAAHDVDAGSMWYYYRPARPGCELADEDIIAVEAKATVSPLNTTGMYPEYHKVWEDDVLKVVAIFGKFEHGATANYDAGIHGYNSFVAAVAAQLAAYAPKTLPPELPRRPGVDIPDVTIVADLPDGKRIEVVVLLVDGVRNAGREFTERYEALSGGADLITYAGHSGLGANIRALAKRGAWEKGQYVIVFMNGCDTYAYVDSSLADAHRRVNDDDLEGTRYLDIVTNAMPAPASQSPRNILALFSALAAWDAPLTYEQIFERFNRSQVVLVSGEQDNVYQPE